MQAAQVGVGDAVCHAQDLCVALGLEHELRRPLLQHEVLGACVAPVKVLLVRAGLDQLGELMPANAM